MKIIYLLILSLFISFNANAVDIYKCNKNNHTNIGVCGYAGWCKDKNGKKIRKWNYTRPRYADQNFNEYDYTIIRDEDRITISNSKGYKKTFKEKGDDILHFLSTPDRFFAAEGSSYVYNKFYYNYGNFYHITNTHPYVDIWSGSCKKQ